MLKPTEVTHNGEVIDMLPLIQRARAILRPRLKLDEERFAVLVAQNFNAGGGYMKWGALGFNADRETLNDIAARAGMWVYAEVQRRRMLQPPLLTQPDVCQFKVGDGACKRASAMNGKLFPRSNPPLVPLADCRRARCYCTLRDFFDRAEIAALNLDRR